jgi:hypothetical protein
MIMDDSLSTSFNHRFYGEPPFSTVPITAEKEMERSGMGEKVGAGGVEKVITTCPMTDIGELVSHTFPCIL